MGFMQKIRDKRNGNFETKPFEVFAANFKKTELKDEFALIEKLEYIGSPWEKPNPDIVLGKLGLTTEALDDVASDSIVDGCLDSVINGVLAREYEIQRNGASTAEEKFIEREVNPLIVNEENITQIVMARFWGYQPFEIIWEFNGSKWIPVKLLAKHRKYFFYNYSNELRIKTINDWVEGIEVPKYKFIVPTFKSTWDNPYGEAKLSKCYWSVFFKKNTIKEWNEYCETCGMPTAKIAYENANQLAEFKLRLENMGIKRVLVYPKGTEIDMLKPDAPSHQIFAEIYNLCVKEIATVILGHEGSMQSTPGRLGAEKAAINVRTDIIDSCIFLVEQTYNQIYQYSHELNFAGKDHPLIHFYEKDNIDDYLKKAQYVNTLKLAGVNFSKEFYIENFNLDEGYFELADAPPTEEETQVSAKKFAMIYKDMAIEFPKHSKAELMNLTNYIMTVK